MAESPRAQPQAHACIQTASCALTSRTGQAGGQTASQKYIYKACCVQLVADGAHGTAQPIRQLCTSMHVREPQEPRDLSGRCHVDAGAAITRQQRPHKYRLHRCWLVKKYLGGQALVSAGGVVTTVYCQHRPTLELPHARAACPTTMATTIVQPRRAHLLPTMHTGPRERAAAC